MEAGPGVTHVRKGDHVVLHWRKGAGIHSRDLPEVFSPFYTTKPNSVGIGLAVAKRIVLAHQGRIELESRVGQGTSFRIWLPLHEARPRLLEAGK